MLIVGDSYRRGVTIPTSDALYEMACSAGFALERKIVRQVPVRVLVSTRDKKTGRFSSSAQSDAQVYPEEHVLIFRRIDCNRKRSCQMERLLWEHSIER